MIELLRLVLDLIKDFSPYILIRCLDFIKLMLPYEDLLIDLSMKILTFEKIELTTF